MGMSHRGRMNVLANFVRKSLTTVLYEFTPNYEPDLVAGDGDVKYHLGYESIRELPDGKVRVSLAANPSHLEAVNSVVEGKARARQRVLSEERRWRSTARQVLPILLHGDAAFAGQGSVAEVLNLSQLPGYRTGGTIHIIINNQIGFTTMPADARSSAYATDVAKMIEAPILHVNGEEPMELYWAALFALEFRQKFGRDIVIDMYCYRRQGHNEADQAAFTQPLIARKIAERPTFGTDLQAAARRARASSPQEDVDATREGDLGQAGGRLSENARASAKPATARRSAAPPPCVQPEYSHAPVPTGIAARADPAHRQGADDRARRISRSTRRWPSASSRAASRRWRTAARSTGPSPSRLAFGSLLLEGTPVRLSGQDCRARHLLPAPRGASTTPRPRERYIPLEHLAPDQAKFCVHNSLLSEFAVLGFDYGYSLGLSENAHPVGGPVRGFLQRRAGHHRPVHFLRRVQVADCPRTS